jgi:hypothetical protein
VKFIVSDHPVTVYNRACYPGSTFCRGCNDPDIWLLATHTFFPLSLTKVLILTNLAWARSPYQNERKVRPNPGLFRSAIFNFTYIQIWRYLSEQEVIQKRALRHVAAAEKEWLCPEGRLETTHWGKIGKGLLLMPEPRDIHMGGQIAIGHKDGHAEHYSEYGHRPWQPGFEDKDREEAESVALRRFQAEFAEMHGPAWRGTSHNFGQVGPHVDSEEYHTCLLQKAQQYRQAARKRRWERTPSARSSIYV